LKIYYIFISNLINSYVCYNIAYWRAEGINNGSIYIVIVQNQEGSAISYNTAEDGGCAYNESTYNLNGEFAYIGYNCRVEGKQKGNSAFVYDNKLANGYPTNIPHNKNESPFKLKILYIYIKGYINEKIDLFDNYIYSNLCNNVRIYTL
jgi:hypothetical protein